MSHRIAAVVLAAGESKRMGKLKQLMPFGGKTILEHSIDNILTSKVNEVVVVLGHEAQAVMAKVANRPVRIAVNSGYRAGIGTSIASGVSLVSDRVEAVMLTLADQPFIDSQIINHIVDEYDSHNKGIVIPVYRGLRGHPVIFDIKYRTELFQLTGDIGGRMIIERYPEDVLEVDVGSESIYIDIDNLESYNLETSKTRYT
ncbi:molybdenum cofactor cytidylyltransferase [Chloroflexota bacterium]